MDRRKLKYIHSQYNEPNKGSEITWSLALELFEADRSIFVASLKT